MERKNIRIILALSLFLPLTPRGFTVRHKTILNGVYWLETDRCEEMLAVCYPIWKSDISIPEQNQGEQLEYDRMYGIDNTLGYLFFSKQNSIIPLHELSLFPEIKGRQCS